LDSDNPRCLGEVGRTGVAIDTIDDMRTPSTDTARHSLTSMTINAPAAVLLLLYELVGEERASPANSARDTQNACSRSTSHAATTSPAGATMRLTTDLFAYCRDSGAEVEHVSISGYHFARRGALPVQEVAFTLCSPSPTCSGITRGSLSTTSPRAWLLLQRPQQRLPGGRDSGRRGGCGRRSCRERFGATDERSQRLRFHTRPAASR